MLKNVTLSTEDWLIVRAREKAVREKTTLNALFRQWLARYVGQDRAAGDYHALMERLSYVQVGRSFSRDELNER